MRKPNPKPKKETIVSLPDFEAIKQTIEIMKISGAPFTVSQTNKTTTINGCLNFRFIEEEKSFSFFAASRELKKAVELYLETNEIPTSNPQYFNSREMKTFVRSEVYNIDLTAAYLYVLKNLEIINDNLFSKLLNLKKTDRLAAIGMLASKKIIFSYDKNGVLLPETEIKENKQLSNVFYYCVEQVSRLMDACSLILGDSFVFYWVDGIYYTDNSKTGLLTQYLYNLGYPCKAETLKNFLYFNNPQSDFIEAEYLKLNKRFELKPKKIMIPKKRGTFSDDMYNYLNSQNGK